MKIYPTLTHTSLAFHCFGLDPRPPGSCKAGRKAAHRTQEGKLTMDLRALTGRGQCNPGEGRAKQVLRMCAQCNMSLGLAAPAS